jgi:hypothetical protein
MKGYGWIVGVAILALGAGACYAGMWGTLAPGPTSPPQSYVGTATAWNNGTKLCVHCVGSLHLLYQYQYYGPGYEDNVILYYYSPNDGITWTYAAACTNGYHASMTVNSAGYPRVARIRWVPLEDWHGELVLFDSLGTDSTWRSKICGIGSGAGSVERPSICIDSGDTAHVAWVLSYGDTTFLCHWQSNWGEYEEERFFWTLGWYRWQFPSICVDWLDRPHIVFQENGDPYWRIMHTYRLESGEWTTPEQVNQTWEGAHPCLMRAHTTSMQVVYDGFEGGNQGVWHNRWETNEYWYDTDQVCQSQLCDSYPVIGERCVVAWQDLDPGEIWGTRGYYDLGQGEYSFFPPTNISQTSTQSAYPHVAVRGKYAYFRLL